MKQFFLSASISLLSCLIGFSCKKEEPPHPDKKHIAEVDWPCYIASDFGCNGISAEQYFYCKLNDSEFCINASGPDTSFITKAQVIVTDVPYISVGGNNSVAGYLYNMGMGDKDLLFLSDKFSDDGISDSRPFVKIGYFGREDVSWGYVMDSIVKTGIPLDFLKSDYDSSSISGFLIVIDLQCDTRTNSQGTMATGLDFTSAGPQPSTSYLRCTEKIRKDQGDHYLYFLTFEFACDLYSDNRGERLWRTLEDGAMTIKVRVNK
ncbi:MAG: hypothetical protein KF734_01330 [Saprospiraceae bacterium]|nr:hypothetical protein [Saprospiraceae bacterium]